MTQKSFFHFLCFKYKLHDEILVFYVYYTNIFKIEKIFKSNLKSMFLEISNRSIFSVYNYKFKIR